jgi:hypothetical protein
MLDGETLAHAFPFSTNSTQSNLQDARLLVLAAVEVRVIVTLPLRATSWLALLVDDIHLTSFPVVHGIMLTDF